MQRIPFNTVKKLTFITPFPAIKTLLKIKDHDSGKRMDIGTLARRVQNVTFVREVVIVF